MSYEFSLGWFFIGVMILIVGVLFARFHQVIADNMGSGVMSYDRYKLWAVGICGLGLVVAVNLHTTILKGLASLFFPGL